MPARADIFSTKRRNTTVLLSTISISKTIPTRKASCTWYSFLPTSPALSLASAKSQYKINNSNKLPIYSLVLPQPFSTSASFYFSLLSTTLQLYWLCNTTLHLIDLSQLLLSSMSFIHMLVNRTHPQQMGKGLLSVSYKIIRNYTVFFLNKSRPRIEAAFSPLKVIEATYFFPHIIMISTSPSSAMQPKL